MPFVDRLPGGGMGPAVVGTLLITGAASLMAIPLGILGGIYSLTKQQDCFGSLFTFCDYV